MYLTFYSQHAFSPEALQFAFDQWLAIHAKILAKLPENTDLQLYCIKDKQNGLMGEFDSIQRKFRYADALTQLMDKSWFDVTVLVYYRKKWLRKHFKELEYSEEPDKLKMQFEDEWPDLTFSHKIDNYKEHFIHSIIFSYANRGVFYSEAIDAEISQAYATFAEQFCKILTSNATGYIARRLREAGYYGYLDKMDLDFHNPENHYKNDLMLPQGYHWINCIPKELWAMLDTTAIAELQAYRAEAITENTYWLQMTKDVNDYTLEHARKLGRVLSPILPSVPQQYSFEHSFHRLNTSSIPRHIWDILDHTAIEALEPSQIFVTDKVCWLIIAEDVSEFTLEQAKKVYEILTPLYEYETAKKRTESYF